MNEESSAKKILEVLREFRKHRHFWNIPDERFSVYETLTKFGHQLPIGSKILDVGAGLCPYRAIFKSHTYHSCDIEDDFFKMRHDFTCSSDHIPVENETYDAVLLIQVLEHLEHPIKTLKEVSRILRPGGQVYISVPQGAGDHFVPYHFYNFTQYGLKSVLSESGFEVVFHYRLDGIGTYVANRLYKLGHIIAESHKSFMFLPLIKLIRLISYILALLISKIDFLDKKRHYCIENIVWAKKPAGSTSC